MNEWHEEIANERIKFVFEQTLDGIRNLMEGPSILDQPIELNIREDEALSERFPALLETSPDTNRLVFEHTQFDELIKKVSPIDGVDSNDIARLYIGCGLTMALFESAISATHHNKVDRLWTVLASTDNLSTEIIKGDDILEGDEKYIALLGVAESSETRCCRINALRFAAGLFFMAEGLRGNEGYGDRMRQSFRDTLKETLSRRDRFKALMMAGGSLEDVAEDRFADEISKLEFALSFPMSAQEATIIIDICRRSEAESIDPEVYIDPNDLPVGEVVDLEEYEGRKLS